MISLVISRSSRLQFPFFFQAYVVYFQTGFAALSMTFMLFLS
jgi:hypothetical protein